MKPSLQAAYVKYKCWIFDCDGVLLNSNAVKTQAFFDVALQYGKEAADRLVAYHVEQGGISRFIKFEYLLRDILDREPLPGELDRVLREFSQATLACLLKCEEAPRVREVLAAAAQQGEVFVVSGGLQVEVRDVLERRGLAQYFTNIFGSPDNKAEIFDRERRVGAMPDPALFIGDAKYDYEMATKFGLDFVFVHNWTDFEDWSAYFKNKEALLLGDISEVLSMTCQ